MDNTSQSDNVVSPSLFSQVRGMMADGSLGQSEQQEYKLEAEDLQGIVETPFDIAALVTKYKGFGLSEKESLKIARACVKPIQRLYGKNQSLDVAIAIGAIMSVATDKVVEYMLWKEQQKQNEVIEIEGTEVNT